MKPRRNPLEPEREVPSLLSGNPTGKMKNSPRS